MDELAHTIRNTKLKTNSDTSILSILSILLYSYASILSMLLCFYTSMFLYFQHINRGTSQVSKSASEFSPFNSSRLGNTGKEPCLGASPHLLWCLLFYLQVAYHVATAHRKEFLASDQKITIYIFPEGIISQNCNYCFSHSTGFSEH